MARGRSTSSSPAPQRHRGKRDRRTSRRSRSPRRRSSGLPVETPPSTTSFENRYPIPKTWTPDDIYLDRQQEYKLTLPRRVVATAWSRDLHIDHQPIEDVRLIDEGFRNRHEAYLWSSLSRKIFKSSDVDIARIIGHLHPSSLKDDWDEKRKGLDRLAERVFDYLRDQMPKNTTEALQDQVEQLMKENEKLKAATGRPSSPALSHSEPDTPAERERLRAEKSQPLVTPPALLARDALWTVTSNLPHLNLRRLLLPFLLILSMPTLLAPTDRYWKTTPRLKPPRVKSTSGSRPISRTGPA